MADRPHYLGHRQRLRDKLAKEPSAPADYEVLELILGYVLTRKDTKPLAKELLNRFKTLRGVMAARDEELLEAPGFGPGLLQFWKVQREFMTRIGESAVRERTTFSGPEDVAEFAVSRLGHLVEEEFWLAMVDNKNRLMGWERISRGTVNEAPVYLREVLAMALDFKAAGIILVHNHPGGDPTPSTQDKDLTARLTRSARDLGIRVLDHLVVVENDYFSFQARGLL